METLKLAKSQIEKLCKQQNEKHGVSLHNNRIEHYITKTESGEINIHCIVNTRWSPDGCVYDAMINYSKKYE